MINQHPLPSWRKLALFNICLLAVFIIASRLVTLLHEVAGHALVAALYGNRINSIFVSLFGGGYVSSNFAQNHTSALFLYSMSGIMVNLTAGIICICLLAYRKPAKSTIHLFWTIFALMSILGAMAYQISGAYYGYGDPVNWGDPELTGHPIFWLPLLCLLPLAAYVVSKQYLSIQEAYFPTQAFLPRIKIAACTLGLVILAYGTLFGLANDSIALLRAPSVAFSRAKQEIIAQKTAALIQKLENEHPELSIKELFDMIENKELSVTKKEVPRRFPILAPLVLLIIAGGLIAAHQLKQKTSNSAPVNPLPLEAFYLSLSAALVILFLILIDGFIFITRV